MIEHWRADEVQDIAEGLIPSFHPHVGGLAIVYLFRSKAAEKNGKKVWGKARKITGLNAYLASRGNYDPLAPVAPQPVYVLEIVGEQQPLFEPAQTPPIER